MKAPILNELDKERDQRSSKISVVVRHAKRSLSKQIQKRNVRPFLVKPQVYSQQTDFTVNSLISREKF